MGSQNGGDILNNSCLGIQKEEQVEKVADD